MNDKLLRSSKLFLKRNASTILTCVGGIGVVATTVVAVKATPKALRLIEEAKEEKGEELTKLEVANVAGPVYIPAVLIGAATIVAIFGANVLNKRQQIALMSAYALVDSSYKDYKKKVEELYGEDADRAVRNSIAEDRYAEEDDEIKIDDDCKRLFFDVLSNRYFRSTMENVLRAEYNLNRQLIVTGRAYLNEFYNFLDIPEITSGKELGWSPGMLESHYWASWIEFDHEEVTMDDGLECCVISMRYEPVIDFAYY